MFCLPEEARILEQFAPVFSQPTYRRFLLLAVAAILTPGRHTVSRLLWMLRHLLQGHPSSYHRVFSKARWSMLGLGRILATLVLACIPAHQRVYVILDDKVDGPHGGKKVYGHACWRDAVRSTRGRTVHKWGHKWVVLAICVRLPFLHRVWALPVLVALARSRKLNEREKRPHKTPAHLGRQLLAVLIHWFPRRKFLMLGDAGFGSHDMAYFCHRHRQHVALVARCRSDLNLYTFALSPKGQVLRNRRGRKMRTPKQTAMRVVRRWRTRVKWYGNSEREMELLSTCGAWYRARGHGRSGLIPIRWVLSHDPQTHKDDWFYTTDTTLRPEQVVESFAMRMSIETTFEEAVAHLGLESTRHWSRQSILRVGPCLLGLFSVVSLIFARMVSTGKAPVRQMPCYQKEEATFSDAIFLVRRLFWSELLLKHPAWAGDVAKLHPGFKNTLLDYLSQAA